MTYDLPFPPSTNHAYATVRGRRVLSKEGRAYKWRVAFELMRQRAKPLGKARLRVRIELHHPTRNCGYDIANYEKLLIDGLQEAGLFGNDNQIDDLQIVRGWKRPPDGVAIVTIIDLPPEVGRGD